MYDLQNRVCRDGGVDGRRRSDIFRLDYILYKKTAALALHLLTAISPMYEYMLIITSHQSLIYTYIPHY